MATNDSKSPYGMLMAILFLLLPSSWVLQMKMSSAKSTPPSAEAKDQTKKEGDAAAEKPPASGSKKSSCPPEDSAVLKLARTYCTARRMEAGAKAESTPKPATLDRSAAGRAAAATKPQTQGDSCPHPRGWVEASEYCQGSQIRPSIALLPERGWGLDGALESLIRGHERAGYTLVRTLLPPMKDESGTEGWLGGLLFEKRGEQAAPPENGQVASPSLSTERQAELVYLVLESPTEGVDTASLGVVLAEIAARKPVSSAAPLRVLGPTFSGSAHRLGWLLSKGVLSGGLQAGPVIQVVSGTATSGSFVSDFRAGVALGQAGVPCGAAPVDGTDKPAVSVQSMVRSDPEMLEGLWQYLNGELHADEAHIALITESSTVYGQAVMGRTNPTGAGPQVSESAPRRFATSMHLPIPSGLSHLREEWARQGRQAAAQNGKGGRSSGLDQVQGDEGRRAALRLYERGTINARDLSLAALLTSICQEGIRYVGLFLTDAQDKEFLAQRIMQQCPNVRLFTMESELSYFHAKSYQFMRGTLIASTYPLYSRNTQWSVIDTCGAECLSSNNCTCDPKCSSSTNGDPKQLPAERTSSRLQFARQADQGLYNATLHSLGCDPLMQEYAPPRFARRSSDENSRPPVWISAVGRDGLLPLQAYEESAGSPAKTSTKDGAQGESVSNPPSVPGRWKKPKYTPYDLGVTRLALLLMSILAFVHSFAFFRNQYGRPSLLSRPHERARFFDFMALRRSPGTALPPPPSPYYLFLFVPVWGALTFLTLVLSLRFRANNLAFTADWLRNVDRAFWEDLGYSLTGVVAMTAMGLALADIAVRRGLPKFVARRWRGLAARIAGSLPVTVLALSLPSVLVALGIHAFNSYLAHGHRWILFLRRSSQTDYELSLLVPTVFLALVGYLWALSHLRRQAYAESRRPMLPAGMLPPDAHGPSSRPATGHLSPAIWLGIVVATTVAMIPLLRRLSTIDHWVLDIAFALALWAVAVSVVTSLVRVGTAWSRLRRQAFWAMHHPIRAVIKGLPDTLLEPLRSLLTTSLSKYSEQVLITKQCQLVHESYADVPEAERQAWAELLPAGAELPWQRLQASLSAPVEQAAPANAAHSAAASADGHPTPSQPLPSPDQELSQLLFAAGVWKKQDGLALSRSELAEPAPAEGENAKASRAAQRFLGHVQELLALRLVVYLFHIVTPLRELMLCVSGSLILTLLALNSYPFQPAESLGTFTWLLLLAVVSLLGLVLLQMRRDPLLSGLASGETGKLDWDTGLGKHVSLVIVAPLLTMLATKVPALGWLLDLWQQSNN